MTSHNRRQGGSVKPIKEGGGRRPIDPENAISKAELIKRIERMERFLECSDKCPNCSSVHTRMVIHCEECGHTEYGNDR